MRMSRKGAGAIALGLGVAFAAAACGGGAGAADAPATAGSVPGSYDATSLIPESGRVGAMEDFGFGDTFRATEPITLDLLYRVHPGYPVEDSWLIWQAFSENNNVTFNREDTLMSDWEDRRNAIIAANTFPTLVPVVWPGQEGPWMASGNLLPVSDFFGYMPHLQHFVDAWGVGDELEARRDANGNIFLLPGLREMPNIEHSFMINQDMFAAAGFGADWQPATFDELASALAAVDAATDVNYAFSDRWGDGASVLGAAMNFVGPNFDTQGGWGLSTTRWNEGLDSFIANPLSDGYRDMVAWFAGLVQDGLLDPELTQDDDTAIQKFINGESAMMSSNFQQMFQIRNDAAEVGIDLNTRMLVVPAGTQDAVAGGLIGPGFVINNSIRQSPYFLATLQFIDWILYSEEGREFAQWGVRGETFDVDAEGNRFYLDYISGSGGDFLNPNIAALIERVTAEFTAEEGLTEEVLDEDEESETYGEYITVEVDGGEQLGRAIAAARAEAGQVPLNATFGFQDGVWMNTWGGSAELWGSVQPAEQRAWIDGMAARKSVLPASPAAPLGEMQSVQFDMLNAGIMDHIHAETARFIMGARPMTEWDAFRGELEGMNINQLVDMLNEALANARG